MSPPASVSFASAPSAALSSSSCTSGAQAGSASSISGQRSVSEAIAACVMPVCTAFSRQPSIMQSQVRRHTSLRSSGKKKEQHSSIDRLATIRRGWLARLVKVSAIVYSFVRVGVMYSMLTVEYGVSGHDNHLP